MNRELTKEEVFDFYDEVNQDIKNIKRVFNKKCLKSEIISKYIYVNNKE